LYGLLAIILVCHDNLTKGRGIMYFSENIGKVKLQTKWPCRTKLKENLKEIK
jgi:hypothetical protein